MVRQLKHHERKLLKKVDFLKWKSEHNLRELQVRGRERGGASGKGRMRGRLGRGHALPSCPRRGHRLHTIHMWLDVRERGKQARSVPQCVSNSTLAAAASRRLTHPTPTQTHQVMRRYHIQGRDDYVAYNRAAGLATKLASVLAKLPPSDETRIDVTDALLDRLYDAGVVPVKSSLAALEKLSTASFARRRLAVVMVRLRMAESVREAATFVEQGHVRVGPATITDPAYHVSRSDEDYVTWVGASAVKRKVAKYNDALEDFDLLN